MKIPLVDLVRQCADLKPELLAAFERQLAGAQFIGGPEVAAFECEFAAFCEAGHAVGTANGTDALFVMLWAAGVGARDDGGEAAHARVEAAIPLRQGPRL